MSALTCDKVAKYQPIVRNAIEQIADIIEDGDVPILSTAYDVVLDLFLALHFGAEVEYPDFVRQYFRRSFQTVSALSVVCDPETPDIDNIESGICEGK